jgi:hypothetical protein
MRKRERERTQLECDDELAPAVDVTRLNQIRY